MRRSQQQDRQGKSRENRHSTLNYSSIPRRMARRGLAEGRPQHYCTAGRARGRSCATPNRAPDRPGADGLSVTRGDVVRWLLISPEVGYVFPSQRVNRNRSPVPFTASHSPGQPASGSAKLEKPPNWTAGSWKTGQPSMRAAKNTSALPVERCPLHT